MPGLRGAARTSRRLVDRRCATSSRRLRFHGLGLPRRWRFRRSVLRGLDPKASRRTWSRPLRLMGQAWQRPPGPTAGPRRTAPGSRRRGWRPGLRWAMRRPAALRPDLPDPREFVDTVLGRHASAACPLRRGCGRKPARGHRPGPGLPRVSAPIGAEPDAQIALTRRAVSGPLCHARLFAAASPLLTPVSLAAAPWDTRLVVIILRGGMDGLDVVQPYGDAGTSPALRPGLRSGRAQGALDLDGFFALHPALAPLLPLWRRGELGFVHAVSTPYRDKRSHFDGQDLLEAGHRRRSIGRPRRLAEPDAAGVAGGRGARPPSPSARATCCCCAGRRRWPTGRPTPI